jgi:hypothetical protein
MRISWLSLWCCAFVLASCASAGLPAAVHDAPALVCEVQPVRVSGLDGVATVHEDPKTWVNAIPAGGADRVVMSAEEIEVLNGENRRDAWGHQDVLANEVVEGTRVEKELRERFDWLSGRLSTGKYVEGVAGTLEASQRLARSSTKVIEARVVAKETDLRCVPSFEGFYTAPVDRDFDRNQCSRLHLGEVVRVLRVSEDATWRYVHAGHSVGWVHGEVLTPVLLVEDAQAFRAPARQVVAIADGVELPGGQRLRMGTVLPLTDEVEGTFTVVVPTIRGLVSSPLTAGPELHVGSLPFTRANIWRLAMSTLGDPYGWGERGGARDCSRLLLDVFRVFGVELGRHSLAQARSGSSTVELKGLGERAKLAAIREAARDSVVLLYMSGHIMLYLGERGGAPFAISAISEFVTPCQGPGDQVSRLDKTAVSGLEVGRDTERTSYLERLSRLAVFGE